MDGGVSVRTDWICHDSMRMVLALLMPANALAVETSLVTGLRIGDVLSINVIQLLCCKRVMQVYEHKTGKYKRVTIPPKLRSRLLAQSGVFWVFEGAHDPLKHRTRQAVWHDVKRAAKALRIKDNVAPHSARKIYACQIYREQGLQAAQKALNHDRPETTIIYIMSELLKSE